MSRIKIFFHSASRGFFASCRTNICSGPDRTLSDLSRNNIFHQTEIETMYLLEIKQACRPNSGQNSEKLSLRPWPLQLGTDPSPPAQDDNQFIALPRKVHAPLLRMFKRNKTGFKYFIERVVHRYGVAVRRQRLQETDGTDGGKISSTIDLLP
jgi:hypothetical protein